MKTNLKCAISMTDVRLAFVLDERVGYGFHSVHRTDHYDRRTSAHDKPQGPRVVRELVRVVGVSQELCGIIDDQVQQRIISLEDAGGLPSALELHANGFVQILGEVDDALFSLLLLLTGSVRGGHLDEWLVPLSVLHEDVKLQIYRQHVATASPARETQTLRWRRYLGLKSVPCRKGRYVQLCGNETEAGRLR